jgi:hypothetical protein
LSLAEESKALFLVLYNDDTLKSLLLIPTADKTNMAKVRDTYIVQSYGSDDIVTNESCKIIYHDISLTETNNDYCKLDGIVFEIYVKGASEYSGLDRRQFLIAGRLNYLLSRKYVGSLKFKPIDKGELYCSTQNYKRYFVKYRYKRIY